MDRLTTFINGVVDQIINPLIALMFAAALVIFLWGGAQYILNPTDTEAQKKAKDFLIWGLLGLFIMASVFGILQVTVGTFFPEVRIPNPR